MRKIAIFWLSLKISFKSTLFIKKPWISDGSYKLNEKLGRKEREEGGGKRVDGGGRGAET